MDYDTFLETKQKNHIQSGFEIQESELNEALFPFQKFCVLRALKAGKYALFEDCGLGKGQPYGSKVLTLDGWVNIENLEVGDRVISGKGKPQKVTGVFPKGEIDTYRFYYSDGSSCVFDREHLHICRTYNDRARDKDWRVLSTDQLLKERLKYGTTAKRRVFDIPVIEPVQFTKKELIISPYILGVILGDGHIKGNISISNPDSQIINRVSELLPAGVTLVQDKTELITHKIITGSTGNARHSYRQEFIDIEIYNKLSYEKHIPEKYLFSDINDRLELLRGLMDTDGYVENSGCCQYYTTSEVLKENVLFLIRSLGGIPTQSVKIKPAYTYNGEKRNGRDCYVITFSLKTFNPFYLDRKAAKWNSSPRDNGRWIDRIEYESKQKTVCISVDSPDKSYVTENFIVTHNTVQQLEWAYQVSKYTNGWVLILAPLAVKGQTIQEGKKFKIHVQDYFEAVKNGDIENLTQGILIANYEQLHNIDCSLFSGIVLDESGCLKNFEGQTKKLIIESFKKTPYKLACTATPSPNDPMELGNHSEFLDVMSRNEMLAMYFVHDGGETSKWRIKGHAVKSFYQFVGTWSIMLNKPEDIGFHMDGYELPPLNLIEKQILTTQRENGKLFNDTAISATNFNSELRLTKIERINQVVEIINSKPSEIFIIWIKHNDEGDLLRKLFPEAVEVKGSDSNEYKEKNLLSFANGQIRILITKSKIAAHGLNLQVCHNQIFPSLDFSFESLYQSMRRSYRFGQNEEVNIYLITTDTMSNVKESIDRKQKQFEIMQDEMAKAVSGHLKGLKMDSVEYNNDGVKNEWYEAQRGDCVKLIKEIKDESIGLSVFSPPFADLYCYSSHLEDMGNSKDYKEFLIQFSYLIKELFRVMMSGRNVCVHCMDIPIQKGKHGFIGIRDFSGMILRAFEEAGFIYHSRITVWKDPVVEMQRTKALGLLHKQVKKDSTMSRVGIPDYVLIFRKDGERENPVKNVGIPVDLWQKYASPVWMDIDQGNTLQGFREGRDGADERHICPLQLDIIERLIHLYSNKGDIVYTPFGGIASEGYQAVKMERRAILHELKSSYFSLLKKNMASAVEEKKQLSIF